MKNVGIFVFVFSLLGCQSILEKEFPDKEDSPFVSIPVNSTLILNEPAEIPAHAGRVYLQDGEFKAPRLLDRYHPNCFFEIKTLKASRQTILPDTFIITRTYRFDNWTQGARAIPTSLYFSNGGPSPENWSTLLFLHSEKQPDVFRMTCQHWEDPTDAFHLSIRQIRQALGKIVTLQIKSGTLSALVGRYRN